MSRLKAMVGVPGGRRTKWLVLVFWLILVVVAGPLSGKLTGAEKNDAQSWLPPKAESTQVLALRSHFVSPNVYPAVVVYDRPCGHDRRRQGEGDRRRPPLARASTAWSRDRSSARSPPATARRSRRSSRSTWAITAGAAAGTASDALRTIAASDAGGLTIHITGPLGYAADSGKAFKGIDGTLLFSALAVVIVLLLITYRSPVLWLLPVICAAVALTSSQAVIYLLAAHAGLTVNAQSAGILDVLVFGAGTDYALLLTAQVPGGAAASRGPARRDGGRAAPGRARRSSPARAR